MDVKKNDNGPLHGLLTQKLKPMHLTSYRRLQLTSRTWKRQAQTIPTTTIEASSVSSRRRLREDVSLDKVNKRKKYKLTDKESL